MNFYVTALRGTVCNLEKATNKADNAVLLIYLYLCHWGLFFRYLKAFVFPANAAEADVGNCALW